MKLTDFKQRANKNVMKTNHVRTAGKSHALFARRHRLKKRLTLVNYDTIVLLIMKTELVTTLKRQATRLISEIREKHVPILITEYGKPAAYLVDTESFETQQARIRILEGIARGENAIQEGLIVTNEQARKRMKRWLA